MKKMLATAVMILLTANVGGAAPAASPSEAVLQTVNDMFDSLKAGDRVRWNDVTASDFHIFERGKDMSRDQIYAAVRSVFDKGGSIEWNVTKPQVEVSQDLATINLVNQGAITRDGTRTPATWFQSATLRHSRDHWQVEFMQSELSKPPA